MAIALKFAISFVKFCLSRSAKKSNFSSFWAVAIGDRAILIQDKTIKIGEFDNGFTQQLIWKEKGVLLFGT